MNKNFDYNLLKQYLDGRSVMVVDPTNNMRESLKRFFANMRVKDIKTVTSAAEAKRDLITTRVGLFVCEWLLPDHNGLELCRSVRQKPGYEEVPFLLVTTENHRSDVVLACEAGVDGYLVKPFSYADFSSRIESMIRSAMNPSRPNEFIAQGFAALRDEDISRAEGWFNRAREEKADSARALCGLGRCAMLQQRLGAAERYFESAILANPEFIEGYNDLLEVYDKLKLGYKRLAVAKKAHMISPENPRYTLILAHELFKENKLDDSEGYFRKTLLLSPRLAEAFRGLGNIHLEKEEYDKAIKNFNKALDLEPGDIGILNSLGLANVRKGNLKDGIEHYKMALRINAYDHRVLFNLGYAHEKQGENQKAKSFYERALASHPDFEKAKRRLVSLNKNKTAS